MLKIIFDRFSRHVNIVHHALKINYNPQKTGCITPKRQQTYRDSFDWLSLVWVTKRWIRFSQKVVPWITYKIYFVSRSRNGYKEFARQSS